MRKENILILTDDQCIVFHPGVKINEIKPNYSWNEHNIGLVLEKIYSENKFQHVGILLNNKLSYTFVFTIDNTKNDSEFIRAISDKISEKIPFSIDEITWDYKIVKFNNINYVQVAAVDKKLLSYIEKYSSEHNVRIDFVEPIAYSLARINKDKKFGAVLFTSSYESVLLLIAGSLVMFAANISEEGFETSIETFISFVRSKYSLNFPQDLYVDDQLKFLRQKDLLLLKNSGFNIISKNLTEYVLMPPDDYKVHDMKLRLNLLDKNKIEQSDTKSSWFKRDNNYSNGDTQPTNPPTKSHLKLFIIIFAILLVATLGFVYWYLNKSNLLPWGSGQKVEKPSVVKDDVKPLSTLIAPKEKVSSKTQEVKRDPRLRSFKGYKVQILNGSGIKGEAEKIKEAILPLSFDDINIGNAENYDYEDTTISFKTSELRMGIELLEKSLRQYPLSFEDLPLDVTYPYDVLIIVGNEKVEDIESEGIDTE